MPCGSWKLARRRGKWPQLARRTPVDRELEPSARRRRREREAIRVERARLPDRARPESPAEVAFGRRHWRVVLVQHANAEPRCTLRERAHEERHADLDLAGGWLGPDAGAEDGHRGV